MNGYTYKKSQLESNNIAHNTWDRWHDMNIFDMISTYKREWLVDVDKKTEWAEE